jgi:micrococcal nuclease
MAKRVPKDEYVRKAVVVEITDGDTVILDADLGCDLRIKMKCRLSGINAPEKNTPEGKDAKAFLARLLMGYDEIIIKTYKDEKEKYGRYLAVLYLPDNSVSLNQQMIDAGHAKPYNGEKRT